MIKWIDENTKPIVTSLIALAGFFGITRKSVRAWIRKIISDQARDARSSEILDVAKQTAKNVDDLTTEVAVLIARDDYRFRYHKFPAFECNLEAHNLRVSDAYLDLLSVHRAEDLTNLDWSQYIHPDDLPSYIAAFQRAAASLSDFGHSARFINKAREPLGKWFITATLHGKKIYFGKFIPDDTLAKSITKTRGWTVPT